MEIENRKLVSKAKREWINTMKRVYPNFNVKLWSKESYRRAHPQTSF